MPGRRGRLRRPARRVRAPWSRSAAGSAWSETTTWRCSTSSTSPTFSPAAAAAVRWTRETAKKATLDFLARARARRREPRGRALPRFPARPGVGVRAVARPGRRVHRHPGRAGQPRRALARRPVLRHVGGPSAARGAGRGDRATGRGARRPGRGRYQARPVERAAGCSTPAASASRATATPGPPGSSSTPTPGMPPTTGSTTTIDRAADAITATDLPDHLARRLYVGQ